MSRVLAVVRMQLVNWPINIAWPWGILFSSFLINYAIQSALVRQNVGDSTTGGMLSIYTVVFVAYLISVSQDLPFALGLGVSRRTFHLASGLMLATEALLYGTLLYLFALIERATDGFGVELAFFGLPFMSTSNPLLQILVYTVPFLLFGVLGFAVGLVFKRWGANGVLTLSVAAILAIGAAVYLITRAERWRAVGGWFVDQSTVGLFIGWPLLLVVPLAALSHLLIRRVTV